MTPQNNLELKGKFADFPLAELLVEIAEAQLNGSLRFSHEDRKIAAYFRKGELVYAISNARSARLFDILLREKKIDKKRLLQIPNFTGDLELGMALVADGSFTKQEIDAFFSTQIEEILRESLIWETGEWNFNPLAQIREGIDFKTNLRQLLAEYSRNLSGEAVFKRFRSLQESFSAKDLMEATINLNPHEAFILSRFSGMEMTIEEVKTVSSLPDAAVFQTLYTLWLGGFVIRKHWNSAFSERHISQIKSANLMLVKTASVPSETRPETKFEPPKPTAEDFAQPDSEVPATVEEEKISLEEYLTQVENAANHYEVLGVGLKAESPEIKQAYFKFAKQFHPDIFHRSVAPELHRQIQMAFTKIANAHETLRDKDLREIYDYKLRKELALMEERLAKGKPVEKTDLVDKEGLAAGQFDQGYDLMMEEYYEEAVPFLARAVHLAPDNARYHAFFGKVLSYDAKQRHKAESEIQMAIKLDPENDLYRIISAEFFIRYGLPKRAEGELKRLLTMSPDNREAQNLLDSLQNK